MPESWLAGVRSSRSLRGDCHRTLGVVCAIRTTSSEASLRGKVTTTRKRKRQQQTQTRPRREQRRVRTGDETGEQERNGAARIKAEAKTVHTNLDSESVGVVQRRHKDLGRRADRGVQSVRLATQHKENTGVKR